MNPQWFLLAGVAAVVAGSLATFGSRRARAVGVTLVFAGFATLLGALVLAFSQSGTHATLRHSLPSPEQVAAPSLDAVADDVLGSIDVVRA